MKGEPLFVLVTGDITRDELSQLLLAYLAISSDIVELFNVFKIESVRLSKNLTIIVLSMWSVSLIQFPMIVTTRKGQKARFCWSDTEEAINESVHGAMVKVNSFDDSVHGSIRTRGSSKSQNRPKPQKLPLRYRDTCCGGCYRRFTDANIWGIILTVILQDGPFLTLRLYLLIKHHVIDYTLIFFICKNALIISVQFYRLLVICASHRHFGQKMSESSPGKPLLSPQNTLLSLTSAVPDRNANNRYYDYQSIGSVRNRSLTPTESEDSGSVHSASEERRILGKKPSYASKTFASPIAEEDMMDETEERSARLADLNAL